MATIITKFSSTSSAVPTASDLVQGELAVNTADKRLFTEDSGATIIEIGTNPSSITTGAITASGTVTSSSGFSGNLTGNVTGDVTGNITGDVTGDVTGSISGGTVAGSTGTFSSNVTAGGTLGVTGATTLSDNLTMSDGRLQITNSSFNLKTFELTGSANTTSTAVYLSANNLTTGKALEVISFSADSSSRSLVRLANTNGVATGTTVLQIDQSSSGNALSVSGDSLFTGDITVTGNATISGNLTFGDADTDSISLNADVDSHILPNTDDTYDLGSTSKQWRNLYINGTANIDSLVADTADINGGTVDNTAIGITTASTGNFSTLSINGTAITATAAELNYTDGVTSNIQTQLDTKAPLASPTFTGTVTIPAATVTGDVSFGDDDKAIFGAGSDLQIYHASNASFIADVGNGALHVRGTNLILQNGDGTKRFIDGNDGGAVEIHYADATNGIKLATTSTGIDVTGTATMDGLTVDGNTTIDGSLLFTGSTNRIRGGLNQPFSIDSRGNASGEGVKITHNSDAVALFDINGDISFYEDTGTTPKFFWDASAESLGIGTTSPAYDIEVNKNAATSIIGIRSSDTGEARIQFGDQTSGNVGRIGYDNTNNSMAFRVNNAERLRIDSSGNVGIGAIPSAWLSQASTLQLGDRVSVGAVGSNDDLHLTNNAYYDGTNWKAQETATANNYYMSSGTHVWRYAASTTAGATVSWSEAMRIDSSGNLLVGKTSSSLSTAGAELRSGGAITGTVSGGVVAALNRLTDDGNILTFNKDGTTVGSIGTISDGIYFGNAASTNYANLRYTNDQVFPCTSAGANNDNLIDLGKPSSRFDDIYATNGTIQTSDRNEKQDIEALSDAEQRVAVAAKGLLRKFRWKSSVEEKGDEARIHFGIIAQDLQAAFEAEGLDAGRYAMFIHSTWTDEETGEERSRMGVRYPELLAFIIAAI